MILVLLIELAKQIIKLIGDNKYVLFAYNKSIKTISWKIFWLSLT